MVKKYQNSVSIGPDFFLYLFKIRIIFNFVKFVAPKKGMTTKTFSPPLLLLLSDPGWIKIRIRDPG
jgi:hypothetical protein